MEIRGGAGAPGTGVTAVNSRGSSSVTSPALREAESVSGQDVSGRATMCWQERNKRKLVHHSIRETEAGEL